jgi:hypothetical protein
VLDRKGWLKDKKGNIKGGGKEKKDVDKTKNAEWILRLKVFLSII